MAFKVLIQAGHEGGVRNSGSSGSAATSGTPGLSGPDDNEIVLTPKVANRAVEVLSQFPQFEVIRENAFYDKVYQVDLALSLHFDGSGTPCSSGASVGYPTGSPPGSNKPTVDLWKSIYAQVWPWKWMKDNFTGNLSGYYGYSWTETSVAEMLIEFGELTCKDQNPWLVEHANNGYLGELVAYFVGRVFDVPVPHPDQEDPVTDVAAPRVPVIGDTGDDVLRFKSQLKALGYVTTVNRTYDDDAAEGLRNFLKDDGHPEWESQGNSLTMWHRLRVERAFTDSRIEVHVDETPHGSGDSGLAARVAALEAQVAELENHGHTATTTIE